MKKSRSTGLAVLVSVLMFSASANAELFLDSTIAFDPVQETITLPLHQGSFNGQSVFYIITESSNRDSARALGVNWSPKLTNALGTAAVQSATRSGQDVTFSGTVDFTPIRTVVPGPTAFPPDVAVPGSVGDAAYSPLATMGDGIVFNAPHVANASGLHDSVAAIDFVAMTVTMRLVAGFYHGKEILYISTEASDSATAALEESTYAPNMNAAPGLGSDDPAFSARSAIVPFVNGQTGAGNPERQGLMSALMGEGAPLNVTEIHPRNQGGDPTYSPLWDVHPAVWTDAGIAAGERVLIDHHRDIADAFEAGWLASGGAGPANPELGGLQAAGFIVNCPIMFLE